MFTSRIARSFAFVAVATAFASLLPATAQAQTLYTFEGTTDNQPWTYGLYIGTMLVTTVAQAVQGWLISRQQGAHQDGRVEPLHTHLVTASLMAAALVIAIALPVVGLWSLLLLLLARPLDLLLGRGVPT